MNQANSRYLLYKDYEAGLNNELMSIELAVGIAYLTNRKLIYYGTVGDDKQLIHIRGGNGHYVPAMRRDIINNQRIPTILDLLEELPVETIDYKSFHENIESQKLACHNSDLRLINTVFVPSSIKSDPNKLDEFAEGRQVFKDVEEDVLHFKECNLGFYSRFFYTPPDSFYSVIEKIRFKKVYGELADKISQSLGEFNGIFVRLSDFRTFLPQNKETYIEEILITLRANFSKNELLVILTDKSENKDFFMPIITEYKNHLFLDEFIIREFADYFKNLPFTDEVTLALIGNIVMHDAKDYIGTPGSSFSAIIHRNWLKKQIQKGKSVSESPFKYVNKGFAGSFKDGIFLETKEGFYSWNRVDLPIHTETKSWYREWVESVVPPPVVTTKQGKFPINLPVKILPILEKSKGIQRKITNFNQTKVKVSDGYNKENENKLILLYCNTSMNSQEQINKLLKEDINWEYIIHVGHSHRILPLLYHRLKNIESEAIPQFILKQLKNNFYNNAQRNLFLTQELLRLLDIFKRNNIIAIPFKGLTLAVTAYGDLSLRMMGDLDIFVNKQDMLKVQELLTTDGYVLQRENNHLTQVNHQRYLNSQYVYDEWYWKTLDHKSLFGVRVEMHWITNSKHIIFPLNSEDLLQNIEPVSLAGVNVPSLAPETLLVVLCLNYTKDHWTQLKMICDISELIQSQKTLNWEKSLDQASRLRRKRTLLLGLYLAHNLLEAPIPAEILTIIQADSEVKSLAEQVSKRLFPNLGNDPSLVEKTLFNIRLREDLQDKIRYIIFSTVKVIRELWATTSVQG